MLMRPCSTLTNWGNSSSEVRRRNAPSAASPNPSATITRWNRSCDPRGAPGLVMRVGADGGVVVATGRSSIASASCSGAVSDGVVAVAPTAAPSPASRSHRDRVGCAIPTSSARAVAVTARAPVIRRTILDLNVVVYMVIALSPSPQDRPIPDRIKLSDRGDNYPDTGGERIATGTSST